MKYTVYSNGQSWLQYYYLALQIYKFNLLYFIIFICFLLFVFLFCFVMFLMGFYFCLL